MASKAIMTMKQEVVEEIKQLIQNSSSVVIVGYQGITAEQDTELRAELRKGEVTYKVLKNRLVRIALNELGYNEFDALLEGPNAVAFSPAKDPVIAAKVLCDTAAKNKNLVIKAGIVDGTAIDVNGVKELASLPSKEILVAKVLGTLQAPITGFVRVLNGTIGGLAIALKAIADNKN